MHAVLAHHAHARTHLYSLHSLQQRAFCAAGACKSFSNRRQHDSDFIPAQQPQADDNTNSASRRRPPAPRAGPHLVEGVSIGGSATAHTSAPGAWGVPTRGVASGASGEMQLDSSKRALAEQHLNSVLSGGFAAQLRAPIGSQQLTRGGAYGVGGYSHTCDAPAEDDPWALEEMALGHGPVEARGGDSPYLGRMGASAEEVQRLTEVRDMKVAQVPLLPLHLLSKPKSLSSNPRMPIFPPAAPST